jgi:protein-arginine kinase/protein-arginine kinase activator protein McsA
MLAFFHVFDYIRYVICAQCGEREAIIFLRRSGGTGEGCDMVLCEACAKGRGIVAGKGGIDLNFDELIGTGFDDAARRAAVSRCPGCGLELSAMMRAGRLGCPSCADAFAGEIGRAIGKAAPGIEEEERAFLASSAAATNSELEELLESSLRSEDYEKAALLRDELARYSLNAGASFPSRVEFDRDFPIPNDSFTRAGGRDDDVALFSEAKLSRNVDGIPFPGSPGGSASPSRALLLEGVFSGGSWHPRTMAELGPVLRRALAERGAFTRNYAADDDSLLVSSPIEGVFATIDDGDHIRLRAIRPGFDPGAALAAALAAAGKIGKKVGFARRPGIGWICSRLSDCGTGATLSVLVHLPAIAAAGMRDRLFRALMAEGVALRGFYSTGEDSSGSLYEIFVEPESCPSPESMLSTLSRAVAKVVNSERRARTEISEKDRLSLADAEGRAFGIARHCGLVGADEAAGLVSTLRLAALRGSLKGIEPRVLSGLLVSLGSAAIAHERGLGEVPESGTSDILRSLVVKAALAETEYTGMVEEGA